MASMRTMRSIRNLTLLLLTIACARKPQPPVILITIDTLRADHLPAYGYRGVATPAIDSLRREAVLFTSAWSHCPMTLPSHVSILTGKLPTEHGVRNNVGFSFQPDRNPTIAQALQREGYTTGAMVSAFVLRGRTGLARAFETYDDVDEVSRSPTALDLERPAIVTAQHAIEWIRQRRKRPFFLFVHFFEPHAPYEPPEPYRSRVSNPYDGEIATADAAVGQVIDELKRQDIYEDALIILTSDHGEGLGDHGEKQHSVLLYTEMIRVPLIEPARASRRPCSTRTSRRRSPRSQEFASTAGERHDRSLRLRAHDPSTPRLSILAFTSAGATWRHCWMGHRTTSNRRGRSFTIFIAIPGKQQM
jgi:arylsulfatase A-like enzyme